MSQQRAARYDAIVVGSGITGGWAAKELTEKGLTVLLLERGRDVEHGKGYVSEWWDPWDFPHRGMGEADYERDYAVQSLCYAFGEATKHFFVKDSEFPYLTPKGMPFRWIRGNHMGGRSLMWGRQTYRWSDVDFTANARDGTGVDWPIRYADIAPWYSYVERFVGVSGNRDGLAQLPDGEFLPPMEMNCGELAVKEGLERAFPGRRMIIGRAAHLTQPLNGRGVCQSRNQCARGCSYGAYFSSLSATLPAARKTGKLTVLSDAIVESVLYDAKRDRASGVRYVDAATKEAREAHGRLVFLCASTLGTAQIMLNSTSARFPTGIANSSGALGHYLMDHIFQAGANGEIPGMTDRYYHGRRPNGIYVPRFRNLRGGDSDRVGFVRGYGYQGGANRQGWGRGEGRAGLGAGFKHALREPGPWRMHLGAWGECLPRYENHVALAPEKDQWGIPLLRIHCSWSENETRMMADAASQAAEMLEAAGCTNVKTFDRRPPPGFCIHEMGTARMGRDPRTSVLNAHNQCHDVPNLFVTDGACMTSSACQNPSITYMALTARACDFAVGEMKRGTL